MHDWLLQLLRDPLDGSRLTLGDDAVRVCNEVMEGSLRGATYSYPVQEGIPRFATPGGAGQDQTRDSFGYKWTNRAGFGSDGMQEKISSWILERYGESGYTTEWLRPSAAVIGGYRPAEDPPVYEKYGEFLARSGQLAHAIRYREHLLPVAAALEDASRR